MLVAVQISLLPQCLQSHDGVIQMSIQRLNPAPHSSMHIKYQPMEGYPCMSPTPIHLLCNQCLPIQALACWLVPLAILEVDCSAAA